MMIAINIIIIVTTEIIELWQKIFPNNISVRMGTLIHSATHYKYGIWDAKESEEIWAFKIEKFYVRWNRSLGIETASLYSWS